MEILTILANIAQILSFIWVIVLGPLTVRQVTQAVVSFFKKRPIHLNRRILTIIIPSVVAALAIFIIISLFFPPLAQIQKLWPPVIAKTTPTATTPTTPVTPGVTVSPGVTSSPPDISTVTPGDTPYPGHTILQQPAPSCNNPVGVVWQTQGSATSTTCSSSKQLAMQNTDFSSFAETDLTRVNGNALDLTAFRAQVTVQFQDTQDTFTSGGLIIRIPPTSISSTSSKVVGYIFELYSDTGQWELLQIMQGQTQNGEDVLKVGSIGQAGQNLSTVSVIIVVSNSTLYAYSPGNGTPLFVWSLPSIPSALGLVTYGHGTIPSANIFFSNFQLAQPIS